MSRRITFAVFFLAVFFQAGAYGLTFMLPRLFDVFGASEKTVGVMLFITAISTLITVYFSGHLSDVMGRLATLGLACLAIAAFTPTSCGVSPSMRSSARSSLYCAVSSPTFPSVN